MNMLEFVRIMANYNAWQNKSIYGAASKLDEEARRRDRGAFYGSIHETLSHLLWGDQIWMARFAGTSEPITSSIAESRNMVENWRDLHLQRTAFDKIILDWSQTVTSEFLGGKTSWYSGALQKEVSRPTGMLVTHMFNHQTHHRGQVNVMLTQDGAKLDDTDLFILEEY